MRKMGCVVVLGGEILEIVRRAVRSLKAVDRRNFASRVLFSARIRE